MGRLTLAWCAALLVASPAAAQDAETPRVVEIEYLPTARAQIAIWLERADGTYVRTLGLTQAVSVRGIGNRPGASQMNSGYLWPYGRREGVLPVWAHRRAGAPGAEQFRRVIFQDRTSEGWASRSSNDFSRDDYFCLSFRQEASSRDALDAVTCPSVFNSDKGRYLTEEDVASGYAEPFQTAPGEAEMRALDLHSLYPPRRDLERCDGPGCYDHADVARFAEDARRVMPEIDAVTMATPPAMTRQMLAFTVPEDWEDGQYVAWIEVNTEGDYNEMWGPERFPTPVNPSGAWDSWAMTYGYPFRGQPSVVYRVPFTLSSGADVQTVMDPWGYGSIDGRGDGAVHEMDGTITNDPVGSPGSGADRLHPTAEGWRVRVTVVGPEICEENTPPEPVRDLRVTEYEERRDAHRYAHLSFVAPADDHGVTRYEVRVSTDPIVDETSFERALPARAAMLESEALQVPVSAAPGGLVEVDFGGLTPQTTYYVAVRALDRCNAGSELTVTEHTTPEIEFTTVSPCFVATAAYGTPMAAEIGALRRFRDRHLRTNALGRAFVGLYETVGPHLADAIRDDETARSWTRRALRPLVSLARALQ
jgi:hypothetical protein